VDRPFARPLIETVRGIGYRISDAPPAGDCAP
jgi:DNA-binding response OmpR family regulator